MVTFTRSISWRLILISTLVMSSVLLVKGVFDFQNRKMLTLERAEQSQALAGARLQLNLPGALWNYADLQIVKIAESELKTPYIYEIQISDNNGDIKFSKSGERGSAGSGQQYNLVYIEDGESNKVGVATLVLDQQILDDELQLQLYSTIFDVLLVDLLLIAALFMLSRVLVTRPLQAVSDAMTEIALGEGDLTKRMTVSRQDEIGTLSGQFNVFVERIQELVTSIRGSIDTLAATSQDAASDASQANTFLESQQSETNLVAAAITQMAASAKEVAANAQGTADSASNARQMTEDIQVIVQNSISSVGALSDQLDKAGVVISELENDVSGIVSVVEVIRGVAEQTNLLALNAAIEAARAGEQGRGFAVVADEVRALASRTQESTEEINQMIDRLQKGTHSAVSAVRESQEKGSSTVESTQKIGQSIEGIVEATMTITNMATQIATAVEQQSQVSIDLDENVSRIVTSGQSSSDVINQIAEKTKSLDLLAAELSSQVQRFKVD